MKDFFDLFLNIKQKKIIAVLSKWNLVFFF